MDSKFANFTNTFIDLCRNESICQIDSWIHLPTRVPLMSFAAFHIFWLGIVPVIRYGCVTLLFLTTIAAVWACRDYFRLRRWIDELTALCAEYGGKGVKVSRGLDPAQLEAARQRAIEQSAVPRDWWQVLDEHSEHYENAAGEERVFLGEAARSVLPYETVVGQHFNAGFYSIVPGLLTGAGLTLTFIAILTALYHVHYDTGNAVEPVSGMPDLINGLSGKFLSSIIALLLSILFTFLERVLIRGLRQGYQVLMSSVSRFLPTLSSKRILLDISDSARKAKDTASPSPTADSSPLSRTTSSSAGETPCMPTNSGS
jgi:hypothetical protein